MDIEKILQNQKNKVQKLQRILKKNLNKISIYRFVFFVLFILLFIFVYVYREKYFYLAILPIASFIAFIYLIYKYEKLKDLENKIQSYKSLLQRDEWRSLKNISMLYREDPSYPEEHFYKDLDIFGKNGLYTYLDTTVTEKGRKIFLQLLLQKDPPSLDFIRERQIAIQELIEKKISSRKILRLFHEISSSSGYTKISFSKYPPSLENFWKKHRIKKILHYPLLFFSYFAGFYLFLNSKTSLLFAILVFNLVFVYFSNRETSKLLSLSRNFFSKLENLERLLKFISKQNWKSNLLNEIHSLELQKVKKIFQDIKKINSRLSILNSPLLHFLANIFLFWDIGILKYLYKIEKENKESLLSALNGLEKLDSLLPFFNFYWHNREVEFPTIDLALESISAKWIGHPLISNKLRVNNPLDLVSKGEIVLITGSNMSGKTTYLRTIGINVLLALCGAPTMSKGLRLPPLKILTSIRNEDSLQEGISFFYSEVKKIAYILKNAEESKTFSLVLIDEVLKGTNTKERVIATTEILKLLSKRNTFNFITTHDLDLAKGKKAKQYILKHFSEQIQDEKMFFDYKIRNGIVNSSNALKILSIECPSFQFKV
jgi:DNA mismatch repair ATPase MutS